MNYKQLISHFGSQAAAARALNISPPSVSEWKTRRIPDARQIEIQNLTLGELKADQTALDWFVRLLPEKRAA